MKGKGVDITTHCQQVITEEEELPADPLTLCNKIPDGVIPLFGDQFTDLEDDTMKDLFSILVKENEQFINKKAEEHVTYLDLNDQDAIYGSSFSMMIKEAFRQDKHFILAKLKSRGQDKFETFEKGSAVNSENILSHEGEIISTFFNAYSILKLIFKKKNADFVGRFDLMNPLTAINPLTNSRLIGEVEFYKIENPFLSIEDPAQRYPEGKSLSLLGIKGTFIGTDYNFCFSKPMQEIILGNCLDENVPVYLEFDNYRDMDNRILRMLEQNGSDQELDQDVNRQFHQVIYNDFLNCKNFLINGIVLGIYRLFGLFALLISISAENSPPLVTTLKEKHRASFADPAKILNHYTLLLPVFSVVYDHQIVRLLHRKEHLFVKVVEMLVVALYWAVLLSVYFSV